MKKGKHLSQAKDGALSRNFLLGGSRSTLTGVSSHLIPLLSSREPLRAFKKLVGYEPEFSMD
jgi:hypothetical protein